MISDGKRGNRKDPNYFLLADQPPRVSYFGHHNVLSAIYPLTLCYLT
jgi:hypothetical protein